MKVVVFGAAGWVGRAILSSLAGGREVRAFDRGPEAWEAWSDTDGDWIAGPIVHGDIADFTQVDAAVADMDAIVHAAVYSSGSDPEHDTNPFLVNLKGLWNVLEAARRHEVRRIVYIGSCQTVHPAGTFFTADVRNAEGGLYDVCKRLQEEMCRQFHDAFGMRIIVLRPDYIVDSRLGTGKYRQELGSADHPWRVGWVCRHDLAEACRLAAEDDAIDFDVFHIVGTSEAEESCDVARSRRVLGLEYKGDLEQYRQPDQQGTPSP